MITAAQAIKRECRSCINAAQSSCITKVCQLHPDVWVGKRSKVRQIKAHCLECAGSIQQAKDCNGRLLRDNGNGEMCWLHLYRMGKNPKRTNLAAPAGLPKNNAPDALCARRIDDRANSYGRLPWIRVAARGTKKQMT